MRPDPEIARLEQARTSKTPWKRWGPYLSERSGERSGKTTVTRVLTPGSLSPDDHARSRAYRWGEDGMAGIV